MSGSPSSSRSPSPELKLDDSTLAILRGFLNDKEESDRKFRKMEEEADARLAKMREGKLDESEVDMRYMSVEEYLESFKENYGLSQFWYSPAFAKHLAAALQPILPLPESSAPYIVFLSSPTAYVAFQHVHANPNAYLLEYDERCRVLAGDKFVKYDLNEPTSGLERLKGKVGIVVGDPPYLNEVTNRLLAQTLDYLYPTPESSSQSPPKFLLLTSTSVTNLPQIYSSVRSIGPLRRTKLEVSHDGGRIQNPFHSLGSWDGCEEWGARTE